MQQNQPELINSQEPTPKTQFTKIKLIKSSKHLEDIDNAINIALQIRQRLKEQFLKPLEEYKLTKAESLSYLNQNFRAIGRSLAITQKNCYSFPTSSEYTITNVQKSLRQDVGRKNLTSLRLDKVQITKNTPITPKVFGRAFLNMDICYLTFVNHCKIELLGLTESFIKLLDLSIWESDITENAGQAIGRYLVRLRYLRFHKTNVKHSQIQEIVTKRRSLKTLHLTQNQSLSLEECIRIISRSGIRLAKLQYHSGKTETSSAEIEIGAASLSFKDKVSIQEVRRGLNNPFIRNMVKLLESPYQ